MESKLVPKKSGLVQVPQYRPITILPAAERLYGRLWLAIAAPVVAPNIDPYQFGGLPGRGPDKALFAVRRTLESSYLQNLDLCVARLDLAKAFDSVTYGAVTRALLAHDLHPALVAPVLRQVRLHQDRRLRYRTPMGHTGWIQLHRGLTQGR
eukprot:1876904-Amphidinium_carterae.1